MSDDKLADIQRRWMEFPAEQRCRAMVKVLYVLGWHGKLKEDPEKLLVEFLEYELQLCRKEILK